RSTESGLIISKYIEGRLYIRDKTGRLVAEINKIFGKQSALSLPPGNYSINLENESGLYNTLVTLKRGIKTILEEQDFSFRTRKSTTNRSGQEEAAREETARPQVQAGKQVKEQVPEKPSVGLTLTEKKKVSAQKIAAFSFLGTGIISAGIGTCFIVDALLFKKKTVDPSYNAYATAPAGYDGDFSALSAEEKNQYYESLWNSYSGNLQKYKTKARLGIGLAGGGVLLTGVSVVLFLLPETKKSNGAPVAFSVNPGIARLSFTVRF
ncbi:MAG: hypothetical protein AB1798_23045, partial [Spirochaetota bacterium]